MYKKSAGMCLLLLIILTICGCQCSSKNIQSDFHFMVLSDTHISSDMQKTERLRILVQKINSGDFPGVELLIVTGDVVSNVYGDYTPDNPDTSDNRLRRAVSVLKELNIPYYLTMGNHDHKIAKFRDSDAPWPREELLDMQQLWEKITGFQPDFSFIHNGWKFIILNSMGGRYLDRHFEDTQLDWLESQLADGLPALLFFHHPISTDNFRLWCKPGQWTGPEKEPRFYSILENHQNQVRGIFVGHGHMFVEDVLFDKIQVYETDSFGEGTDNSYYVVNVDQQKQAILAISGEDVRIQQLQNQLSKDK